MQQRSLGAHGSEGLPARARHAHLGPRHRRARGPRPADRVRRRPAARCSTPRPGYGDGASEELIGSLLGDVVARDDVVLATKAGDLAARARRTRETNVSRGSLIRTLDQSLRAARGRPRRPVAGAHLGPTTPRSRRRCRALDYAVSDRPGVVRRDLELLRLADRAGGHLAAGGAGPGAARLDAGGVLPAQPRRRARGARRRRGAGARRARLVAAGTRRAHRQVPHRHPGGLAGGVAALRELRGDLPQRPLRSGSSRRSSAPPRGWTGRPLEVALAWVRDRPGVTAPIVGARTAAQLKAALGDRRAAPCPPRSRTRSTTCPEGTDACPLPPDEPSAPVWSGSSTSWSCRASSAATW